MRFKRMEDAKADARHVCRHWGLDAQVYLDFRDGMYLSTWQWPNNPSLTLMWCICYGR